MSSHGSIGPICFKFYDSQGNSDVIVGVIMSLEQGNNDNNFIFYKSQYSVLCIEVVNTHDYNINNVIYLITLKYIPAMQDTNVKIVQCNLVHLNLPIIQTIFEYFIPQSIHSRTKSFTHAFEYTPNLWKVNCLYSFFCSVQSGDTHQ